MLIPSQWIFGEAVVLAVVLIVYFWRTRDWIAGILILPVCYLVYAYWVVDQMGIEDARTLARFGWFAFLLVLIMLFLRILWVTWRTKK